MSKSVRILSISIFAVLALVATVSARTGRWDNAGWVFHDSLTPGPNLFAAAGDPDGDGTPGVDMSGADEVELGSDDCTSVELDSSVDEPDYLGASLDLGAAAGVRGGDNIYVCEDGAVSFGNDIIEEAGPVNRALPDVRLASALVLLPFYDDLAQDEDSVISILQDHDCGDPKEPDSCTTVEWRNMALEANAAAVLTFQLTFSEFGDILFNYLTLTGAGSDGSSATIGIQGEDATAWNQYSFNTASGIASGVLIGFGIDTDKDGLSDAFEKLIGTDPEMADTDEDGVRDGGEVFAGTNPLIAFDHPELTDADSDGLDQADEDFLLTSDNDADSDDDGIDDLDELELFEIPLDPMLADSDGDGVDDMDEDLNGDGSFTSDEFLPRQDRRVSRRPP